MKTTRTVLWRACPLWILVNVEGPTGHGSRFIEDTAISKLLGLANKAFEF